MNKVLAWSLPVVLAIVIGAFWYFKKKDGDQAEPAAVTQAPAVEDTATVNYPIAAQADSSTLPSLDDSDAAAKGSLEKLFGPQAIAERLIPKDVIRHIVATVDNLPRKKVAVQLRPIRSTSGAFIVSGVEGATKLSEQNYARYQPIVQWVHDMDVKQLAAWYRRFYPLFQEAYAGLGYPSGYFNDRLVEVINHLLATPEIQEPLRLVQPNVFYEFADSELEARSAGQKTLLRMGPANIAVLKIKLREFRAEITGDKAAH